MELHQLMAVEVEVTEEATEAATAIHLEAEANLPGGKWLEASSTGV